MSVKINKLEIENVKRVKAVTMEPTQDGLTVIGGKNNQGKTSVLDAIAWALGGDRFRPSEPRREGSTVPPHLHITLSNGLVVERKGANSALKVIDPSGNKAGQSLLNEFVESLALDLPKFMNATAKEKAQTLLQIIGVGDRLYELESEEQKLYNQRHSIGQIAEQKQSAADEMISCSDAPAEPVSASDLIQQQQIILTTNGENQHKREQVAQLNYQRTNLETEIEKFKETLRLKNQELTTLLSDLAIATKSAEQLQDESTEELERNIATIDEINQKVRVNQAKALVEDEAAQYKQQYADLTDQIEAIRADKTALLDSADLPLEGLSVEDGELTYNHCRWDNMSASEQLRVSTAIVRKLNPNCGFVLLDKLEQMDLDTLSEFGAWLKEQNLQVIATRVSTGNECSIIIEDGYSLAANDSPKSVVTPENVNAGGWKAGEF